MNRSEFLSLATSSARLTSAGKARENLTTIKKLLKHAADAIDVQAVRIRRAMLHPGHVVGPV
jgi:hypothetical protein